MRQGRKTLAQGLSLLLSVMLSACGQVGTHTSDGSDGSAVAPSIRSQPSSQAVAIGTPATFSVGAVGSDPLSYQWQRNGTVVAEATGPTYTIASATQDDDGATFSVEVSNVAGAVQSGVAQLTVMPAAVAPVITTQPANQSVTAGQPATFSVVASGTSPLTYQWLRSGAAIAGATSAGYTTPATTQADNGATFTVTVTNSAGSAQSTAAALAVVAAAVAPTITSQPGDQGITSGQTATFSVVAAGTAPLAYQWQKSGTPIGGATAASYTTPAESTADDGALFAVTVSNTAGSVLSRAAKLSVAPSLVAPAITAQPASQTITSGQTATFSVTASGTAPLTYQWQANGTTIPGATASSYTTPAETTAANGTLFSVVVTNAAGFAQSDSAKLTVTAPQAAPTITTQPANQTATVGFTATFGVTATGSAPLTYQWRKNGTAIAGATSASYTTPALALSDSGAVFVVVVSNAIGMATSTNAVLTVTAAASQHTNVVMYKYDNSRSGQNLKEKTLTPGNVNSSTFGLLRLLGVDGKVDAQPLYISGLVVNGASHNVVFVETENDSAYAFDSDTGAQLWKVSLVPAGETVSDMDNCKDVEPTIGITSTPVIDTSAGPHGTIFMVAMTQSGTTYLHRLHALDVTTGAELAGGPTQIAATYHSSYLGRSVPFDSSQTNEHAALLLNNGTIYTTWTSQCDHYFYTGWILAYGESSLQQTAVLNVGVNSGGIGPAIWMAGSGPAVDSAGNIYLLTANGGFETTLDANGFPNMGDFGNSFMRISTAGGALTVADYFSPYNTLLLSNHDLDLGAGGILLPPDQVDSSGVTRHLAIGAGKDGNLYVVTRDNMGHFNATTNNIWQQISSVFGNRGVLPNGGTGGIWSTPAYFNGHVYYSAVGNTIMSFALANAQLTPTPVANTAVKFPYPGALPTVSANGTSNAIVWAQYNDPTTAVLYAFDATTLAKLYGSSDASGGRDNFGAGNKFIVPVVADGKVFVGTNSGVAVFGLLP